MVFACIIRLANLRPVVGSSTKAPWFMMASAWRKPGAVFAVAGLTLLFSGFAPAAEAVLYRFHFGPGAVASGYLQILPSTIFSEKTGFGFEPGPTGSGVDRGGRDPLRGDFITSERSFFFSVRVPAEGNYRVTVILGDAQGETTTTIKAELRRLMVEKVHTKSGEFATVSFIVNTRTPVIAATGDILAGEVKLKTPRESIQEGWAWDDWITLEFGNAHPAVCAVEIARVEVPTIYLLGDSTVCDQSREPYASWGQMLTRFFKPEVAIANHGESGETYRDSIGRRRLDKVLSVMKPGDYLIMQFGHNDQKQVAAGTGGPFTTYKAEIRQHVGAVRRHGGIPVIVSPMERREFDENGRIKPSLADYAEASRQAAQELQVAFIDLNAMSIPFYEALGPEKSELAFVRTGPGKVDNTHHDNYGAYELAKCVVQGIKDAKLGIARYIVDDFRTFDPSHPDRVENFDVPPSPVVTIEKPFGN
jgi:lysophospholipase L1-like esterase